MRAMPLVLRGRGDRPGDIGRRNNQIFQIIDALVEGDETVLEEIISNYPGVDRQHLRQLVRNAAKEQQANKPPKSSRQLFQYLKSLTGEA